MKSNKRHQGGFSFLLLFFVVAMVIFMMVFAMKTVPAYINHSTINKLFKTIASDPAMANATSNEIRTSFSKRSCIDGVTDISAEDIEIENGEGALRLSASYTVKVPLIANISLLMEFNSSSD